MVDITTTTLSLFTESDTDSETAHKSARIVTHEVMKVSVDERVYGCIYILGASKSDPTGHMLALNRLAISSKYIYQKALNITAQGPQPSNMHRFHGHAV